MEPEIVEGDWWQIETREGTEWLPADVCQPSDAREPIISAQLVHGWGCRLSMPGYVDATDWSVCDTHDEARGLLIDMYDLCPRCLCEEDVCECDVFDDMKEALDEHDQ